MVWELSLEDADKVHEIISNYLSILHEQKLGKYLPLKIWSEHEEYKKGVYGYMISLSEAMRKAREDCTS